GGFPAERSAPEHEGVHSRVDHRASIHGAGFRYCRSAAVTRPDSRAHAGRARYGSGGARFEDRRYRDRRRAVRRYRIQEHPGGSPRMRRVLLAGAMCVAALASTTATWEMNSWQDFVRGRFTGLALDRDG